MVRHLSSSEAIAEHGIRIINRVKSRAAGHTCRPFVDIKRITVHGGTGGDGCIAFERLFCNPDAGPGGGNGGNGGHIILEADSNVADFSNVPTICKGSDGGRGSGSHRHGANAKHTIVKVPLETQVHLLSESSSNAIVTPDVGISAHRFAKSTLLATLKDEKETFIAGRGGAGGRGNAFFAASNNLRLQECQRLVRDGSLRLAERGACGENKRLLLRLPNFADIGLVGAPNAGKSTLLRRLTRSRPRVAPHPFTTLKPHVGTLLIPTDSADADRSVDVENLFIADLPGLIEGAATSNRGLGADFLSLVEGCSILIYLIDVGTVLLEHAKRTMLGHAVFDSETMEASAAIFSSQLHMLHRELSIFNPALVDSSRVLLIIGTKIDLLLSADEAVSGNRCSSPSVNKNLSRKISQCLNGAVNDAGISVGENNCKTLIISARRGDNIDDLVNLLRKQRTVPNE